MNATSQTIQPDKTSDPELNLDLAYGYTRSAVEARHKSLDTINARLATFLGFGGLLLRFGADLPDRCNSCLLLKLLVLALATSSVCISALGLTANRVGSIVAPRTLMSNEWFNKSHAKVKATITNTWLETIETLEELGVKKGKRLNLSIKLLALSIVFLTLNLGIAAVFEIGS